tara:strand:+ start:827 stop:1189 length:363 start_codon:yes stop_codon:yes gene_type:complete
VDILDLHSKKVCEKLLKDLRNVDHKEGSVEFFRQDNIKMIIWLFIMDSYGREKIINIEDISREIAMTSKISKPSLRLILEQAKEKNFIKFTHNPNDSRSWIVEPESSSITDFNTWTQKLI